MGAGLTPEVFIAKWHASTLTERAAAQSHFNDLCDMLGVEKPTDADPKGEWFCFERGAAKTAGGDGWADVWKRGHFGWEYKGKRKNLTLAYVQLQQYAVALENPPLLVVSDMDRFVIHTNWTNTVSEAHTILLDDLLDHSKREILRFVFTEPPAPDSSPPTRLPGAQVGRFWSPSRRRRPSMRRGVNSLGWSMARTLTCTSSASPLTRPRSRS